MRWSVASADCFTPKRSLVRSQYRPLAQNAPDLQGQGHSLSPSGTRALNVPRDRTVSLLRTLVDHVPLGSCFTALCRRKRALTTRKAVARTIQPVQPIRPVVALSTGCPAVANSRGRPATALRKPCAIAGGQTLSERSRSQPNSALSTVQ